MPAGSMMEERERGGLSQAAVWVQVAPPAENRSTGRRSCSGARHQLGLSFIPRSLGSSADAAAQKSAQNESSENRDLGRQHIWSIGANECFLVSLLTPSSLALYFGHNADHLPCSTPRDEEGLQFCTFHSSRGEKYGHCLEMTIII